MRHLSYLGETVLTTDGIGQAVVDYARALVAYKSADVIDIPVVVNHGESMASLLLGPETPLMVVEAEDGDTALEDEMPIARIRARIAALGPHRARPTESFITDQRALGWDFL